MRMLPRRLVRSVTAGCALAALPSLATVLSAGGAAVGGCSSSATPATTGPCADGGAIVRLGSFTDEACLAFLEAEQRKQVVTDPVRAPQWTAPPAGTLPAATPPTFVWTKGTLAIRPRPFSWVRAAAAHGITTGDGYVLTFRDGGGNELLRVMSTNAGFAPDAARWKRLAGSKRLVVSLVGARFSSNQLATGVAPTAQTDVTFTVE